MGTRCRRKTLEVNRVDIWTATFWKATAERVIGTAAAAFIAAIGDAMLFGDVTWERVGSYVLLASIVTVAKSLIAGTGGGGPGFGSAETLDGKPRNTHRADVE